jgi:hypothetical protein
VGAERFWTATPACGWDVSRLARKFIMAGDEPLATFKVVAHRDQARDDFLASTAFPREAWRLS